MFAQPDFCQNSLLHVVKFTYETAIDTLNNVGNEWIVGYGLDFAEHDRTLPYIGIVQPDDQ